MSKLIKKEIKQHSDGSKTLVEYYGENEEQITGTIESGYIDESVSDLRTDPENFNPIVSETKAIVTPDEILAQILLVQAEILAKLNQ